VSKLDGTTGLGPSDVSSLMMVTLAEAGVPRLRLKGSRSVTEKVSGCSTKRSSLTRMSKDLLDSPGADARAGQDFLFHGDLLSFGARKEEGKYQKKRARGRFFYQVKNLTAKARRERRG
jgi:hypothetical protein